MPMTQPNPYQYPAARRADNTDIYHGVVVADPYRWLEQPNAPETRAWIEAENALSSTFLEAVPARAPIKERLTRLWDYEKYGVPWHQGGRYFFFKNDGLQNQSVLYTSSALDAEPRVLLDPNTLSADGTVALVGASVSEDGALLAYALSSAGSDWQEWRVREVASGADRPDSLRWSKFSDAAWTHDGEGFFYSHYDEPPSGALYEGVNYYHKLSYHRIGADQGEDTLIYANTDQKEWLIHGGVSDDGRYLIISISQGTSPHNQILYRDLSQSERANVALVTGFDAEYHPIDNDGPIFWFRTNHNAPHYRVIAVDVTRPEHVHWREVIAETGDTLEGVSAVGGILIASYLVDACSAVRLYTLDGAPAGTVALPGIGTAAGFGGRRDEAETFYAFTSFTYPTTIFHYDLAKGESSVVQRPRVDFRPEDYETVQVFVPSADGTRIPLFLTHRRGLERNGQNPTHLYGYGGFNIPLTPAFSVTNIVWLELGGVYAQACLRGGGEYGEDWYKAGTKLAKQNVFDDFIAVAEWLIAAGYTSTVKLAISGRSNGGLLVGAALTQRPELFGAALPGVVCWTCCASTPSRSAGPGSRTTAVWRTRQSFAHSMPTPPCTISAPAPPTPPR